jgi:hypothetical protein
MGIVGKQGNSITPQAPVRVTAKPATEPAMPPSRRSCCDRCTCCGRQR